jgi:hypothetical protein
MTLIPHNENVKCDCLQPHCPYCGKGREFGTVFDPRLLENLKNEYARC